MDQDRQRSTSDAIRWIRSERLGLHETLDETYVPRRTKKNITTRKQRENSRLQCRMQWFGSRQAKMSDTSPSLGGIASRENRFVGCITDRFSARSSGLTRAGAAG